MTFIKNIWYAAGWTADIDSRTTPSEDPTLFARTIAGIPLVIYRSTHGKLVTLRDRCAHRFVPLSKGKRFDDIIECPYHGLRFDSSGTCIRNPHGPIPKAARVDTYPTVEQNGLVWVWLGNADKADDTLIPDFGYLDDHDTYTFGDGQTMHMDVNYALIVDNLLDLSHVAFLHQSSLGTTSEEPDITSAKQDGSTIYSNRTTPNCPPAPVFHITGAADPGDRVDYWTNMRWDPPASFYLDAGIVPTGQPKEQGTLLSSVQIVSPETENSSFYFFKMMRTYRRDDTELSAAIDSAVIHAFSTEDEPMVAAAQDRMAGEDFWDLKPVLLTSDAAAVMARRTLAKLQATETTEADGTAQ